MAKVLVLHWGTTAAGPALTLAMARHLQAETAHDVSVSYSRQADVADEFERLDCPQLPVTTWESAAGVPMALLRVPATLVRLVKFIRRHEIDVVLVPMEQVLQAFVAWAFGPLGVRYVFCLHDGQLHPGEEGLLKRIVRRAQFVGIDSLVVFSQAVAEKARELLDLPERKVTVTHLPPVLSAQAPPAPRTLEPDRSVRLGMFGRVVAYKGYDTAVAAGRLVRERVPGVELRLVGKGVSSVVAGVKPAWLRLEDRWLADEEIPILLREFDLLLLPYREASQSGVLVEAMALGLPVVVTPVGGLPEQIRSTGGGVVSEGMDAESLANAIVSVIESPEIYQGLSEAGVAAAFGPLGWGSFLTDLDPALSGADDSTRMSASTDVASSSGD